MYNLFYTNTIIHYYFLIQLRYMYDLSYVKSDYIETLKESVNKDYLLNDLIDCKLIQEGYILPTKFIEGIPYGGPVGGVFTSKKEFIIDSLLMNWGDWYNEEDLEMIYEANPVLYIGTLSPGWGHFITDSLKKLWFLLTPEYQIVKDNVKLVCNIIPGFKFKKNHIELLLSIGINASDIHIIQRPTKFKEIYLPDSCFKRKMVVDGFKGRYYTKEYLNIIQFITNNVRKSEVMYDKVYYSRTKLNDHRDVGENEIEKLFKKIGYKVIYPEKLSLKMQLLILKNCKIFASTEGSISHNAIFLNTNTQAIILRKYAGVNEYQLAINSAKELNVIYIDANLTVPKTDGFGGPFYIYINDELRRFAKDFANFNIPFSYFNYSDYSEYLRRLIMTSNYGNLRIDETYDKLLKAEMPYTQLRYKFQRPLYDFFSLLFPFLSVNTKIKLINKVKSIFKY